MTSARLIAPRAAPCCPQAVGACRAPNTDDGLHKEQDRPDTGVRIALGMRYTGRQGNIFHLAGRDGPTMVRARFVVGADGARSGVARDLALDRNHHLAPKKSSRYPAATGPPHSTAYSTPHSPPAIWPG